MPIIIDLALGSPLKIFSNLEDFDASLRRAVLVMNVVLIEWKRGIPASLSLWYFMVDSIGIIDMHYFTLQFPSADTVSGVEIFIFSVFINILVILSKLDRDIGRTY